MFRVYSHDHDGYDMIHKEFPTFEEAYSFAKNALEEYAARWGDFRYWQDALIKEDGKHVAVIYRK